MSKPGYAQKQIQRAQSARIMNNRDPSEQLKQFTAKYNNLMNSNGHAGQSNNEDEKKEQSHLHPRDIVSACGNSRPPLLVPLNFKTIKNITNGEPIVIQPAEVEFRDVEVNQAYEMVVQVQNLSKLPKRIKLLQPQTQKFRVDYDQQGSIAPGLAMRLIVIFETNVLDDFADQIKIFYEGNNGKKADLIVPLHAFKPQPQIKFEQSINLGFVRILREKSFNMHFKNEGRMPGKVKILCEHLNNIRFEPQFFTVMPQETTIVKLIYSPKDPVVFRGEAEVSIEGQTIQQTIDINATAVEYNRFITDHLGTRSESLEFGELYFGFKKEIGAFLVNNTPQSVNYKITMRIGYISQNEEEGNLQTPAELGREQTEQIIKCSPMTGRMNPYSQLTCRSNVEFKHNVMTKNYALSEDDFKQEQIDFTYTAIVRFEGDDEPIYLVLTSKGVCPQLKLSTPFLKFGECPVHDHREITFVIENKHRELPIDVSIPRIPGLSTTPATSFLQPHQKSTFVASFAPFTVGKFHKDIMILLLNSQYQIPLQASGLVKEVGDKKIKQRGPDALPGDFQTDEKYLDENNKDFYKKKKGFDESTNKQIQLARGSDEPEINIDKLQEIKKRNDNRLKYTQLLRDERESRILKEKDRILKMRADEILNKGKEKGLIKVNQDDSIDDDKHPHEEPTPVDLEFELRMVDTKLEEPNYNLPAANDPLFVLRPIGQYEPIREEAMKHFHPDPESAQKKWFSEKPSTHKDARDIQLELDGASLMKVLAGPKSIDFGTIYVKSRVSKTFTVKNDLRTTIKVQLIVTSQELKETYQRPQLIPTSETAKFEIVLCSLGLDDEFKQFIKYVVNDRHSFELEVKAKIQQVKLELSKPQIKMTFAEDNMNMETSDSISISNSGNAPGKFFWDTQSKLFSVDPKEGYVPAKGTADIKILYRPSISQSKENQGGGLRAEEDKLIMRVQDGQDQTLKCVGVVNEAKCQLKQNELNLGQILVSKESSSFFQIKNTSRIPAIFRVLIEQLPDYTDVVPVTGKILPDQIQELSVKFCCSEERQIDKPIQVLIRGGKVLSLPFQVKTIVPKVEIKEAGFDFGKITTLGNSGVLPMTIQNLSNIDAELMLDMRGEDQNPDCPDGIDCLAITPVEDLDESVFKVVHMDLNDNAAGGGGQQKQHDKSIDNNNNDDAVGAPNGGEDSESENNDVDTNQSKLYCMVVKAGQSLRFELKFAPKDVKPYSFELPITLQRYGKLPGLARLVQCRGMKPKFLVDPQIVEFPRKIITAAEKTYPTTVDVILANPEKKAIAWRLQDKSLQVDNEQQQQTGVFAIHPLEGRVDPGQTLRIKASFNPQQPGEFEKSIPLFIDDPELPAQQPCLDIVLKGIAAFPKLLFDRREVLMPVVPLNIESRCSFKLVNDGYENLNVKYRVMDELGNLNLQCDFPDGKTLGVGKNKIKVDVYFSMQKPISFTSKIEFSDEQGKVYSIPVSGTADNCLFTNFQYLQRNQGEFKLVAQQEAEGKGPILLKEDELAQQQGNNTLEDSELGSGGGNKHSGHLLKRHATMSVGTTNSRSSNRGTIGYNPVPRDKLESSREYIKTWLNSNVLATSIQNFPDSVIESNGDQFFELLTFLTGRKEFPYKVTLQKNIKRAERADTLVKQYNELVKFLKTEGALLNHIRPHYLLHYHDYFAYVKNVLPKEQSAHVTPAAMRLSLLKFQYFSIDSWITLFYQILKLFYVARINSKVLKGIPNCLPERATLPDYYLSGSNIFSTQEGILLRWLELNTESTPRLPNQPSQQLQPGSLRMRNFDESLQDGHIIATLIQNYLWPPSESLTKILMDMRRKVSSEDDIFYNCERVQALITDIRMQTPFNPMELAKPSQREMILFLMQLYNALPHYIPKGQPIIFNCVLGEEVVKTIELSNPTQRPISYWVKYDGSTDFIPEFEDSFKIDAKQTFKFKVKFVSRVSRQVTGRLTFTHKKDTNMPSAAALVFELRSQITGIVSIKHWDISSSLYESKEFTISVQNTFQNSDYGEFSIALMHDFEIEKPKQAPTAEELAVKDKKKKVAASAAAGGGNKKQAQESVMSQEPPAQYPSFFCKTDRIRLKRNATFNLNLSFIPMVLVDQKCYIIFSDPNVGEFQHEILGKVSMPDEVIEIPQQPITPPIYVDEPRVWMLQIPFKNDNIKSAKKNVEQWLIDKQRKGSKDQTGKQPFQFPVHSPDEIVFDIELEQPSANAVIIPKNFTVQNPHRSKKAKEKKEKEQQQQQQDAASQNNQQQESSEKKTNQEISFESKKGDQSSSLLQSGAPPALQGQQQQQQQQQQDINQIPFTFMFKNPYKDYRVMLVLRNANRTDVRRYKLQVTALPKPVKATLEMTAPAKEVVVQEIPIVNNSDKDWHIRVQLMSLQQPGQEEGAEAQKNPQQQQQLNPNSKKQQQQPADKAQNDAAASAFIVAPLPEGGVAALPALPQTVKDFIVKKKSTGNVPIIFAPQWICKADARLVLTNPITNDVFDYELHGVGEEPLAEDHIIINCRARTTTKHDISLTNPYADKPITYAVETDLVGASGPPTITIPAKKKKGVYTLSITPVLSGQYTGSISFTDPEGRYLWWTVLLNTESPPADKCIDLITNLRKAIAFEISLANPINESVVFEVLIDGDGLLGESYFQLPPHSMLNYELIFMPLKVGKWKGSIAFVNDRIGEIWYELNLISDESDAIRLPMLKAELGKIEMHEIILENPSDKDVKVRYKVSNPVNFEVQPSESIVIPAMDITTVQIRYLPSALDQTQTADIFFETNEIGNWHYMVYGMGLPPTKFDPKQISVGLNKDLSSVIHFKNPFKDPIKVRLYMEPADNSSKDCIRLLLKGNREEGVQSISGLSIIQIPFAFSPREIRCYSADIVVFMNDKIQWRYPIVGITESFSQGVLQTFKTKSRQLITSDFEVQLQGVSNLEGSGFSSQDNAFTYELRNIPEQYVNLVHKCFKLTTTKNFLTSPEDKLRYQVEFHPMKPFKTTFDFVVIKKSGGFWKFKLSLESTMPNEDDVIVMSAPLHTTSSLQFRLTNRTKDFATFTAYYTPDSGPEFAVSPRSGLLEPFGKLGTQFVISFTPVEYGKTRAGKLIIETDDMLWSYGVKGVLPKYIPPLISESKIDNRLDFQMQEKIKNPIKKNFLAENIKQTKDLSPKLLQSKRSVSPSQIFDTKSIATAKSKQTKQSRLFSAQTRIGKTQM